MFDLAARRLIASAILCGSFCAHGAALGGAHSLADGLADGAQPAGQDPLEILDEEIEAAAAALSKINERKAASAELSARAIEAFGEGDYKEAERILLEQREVDPENFVVHYNLACARAVLGELDSANEALRRAVELGFANRGHLERDPYLAPLRETDDFRMLVDNWDRVIGMQRAARLEQAKGWVRGKQVILTDNGLRIDVVSAHGEAETDAAMREIERVAGWAATLMPVTADEHAREIPFVVVALPDERDFLKWAFWTYGERARRAFAGIGGSYEHDEKRLVAQDLGSTLRHEFFHVLHWRDMDRLGQVHPIWIQEGLASLVEDMDPARIIKKTPGSVSLIPTGVDARLVPAAQRGEAGDEQVERPLPPDAWLPVPSWRTNIVKRLGRTGGLPDFEEFTSLDHRTFSTSRPLAMYAHARTIFLYLQSRGVLGEWYRRYTTDGEVGYNADPSGIMAMEAVLDTELPDLESMYGAWVRETLPMVAETGSDLDAAIGVEIEQKELAGPMVSSVSRAARRRTGLRRLDIITAIDNRPVRDMKELIRVLSAYAPGESVKIDYRRVNLFDSTDVELIRRR